MIRVGVLGACGRMGRTVCAAIAADPDLDLVAAVDPANPGASMGDLIGRPDLDLAVVADLDAAPAAEVLVDFTRAEAAVGDIDWAVRRGVHIVVGTTGIPDAELERIRTALEAVGSRSGVIVVPNFAIGAVLMQRFAEEAARHLPDVEVIELHHHGKVDAPSGTAIATAKRIAAARAGTASAASSGPASASRGADIDGVPVHAVRLPGLVAHQEVILGGPGQILTIRHDSTDRTSFMPGVVLAVKQVASRPGLTLGLEPLLEG